MAENENEEQLNATGDASVEEELAPENDVVEGDDSESGNGEPGTEEDVEEASEGGQAGPPPADECPPVKVAPQPGWPLSQIWLLYLWPFLFSYYPLLRQNYQNSK